MISLSIFSVYKIYIKKLSLLKNLEKIEICKKKKILLIQNPIYSQ